MSRQRAVNVRGSASASSMPTPARSTRRSSEACRLKSSGRRCPNDSPPRRGCSGPTSDATGWFPSRAASAASCRLWQPHRLSSWPAALTRGARSGLIRGAAVRCGHSSWRWAPSSWQDLFPNDSTSPAETMPVSTRKAIRGGGIPVAVDAGGAVGVVGDAQGRRERHRPGRPAHRRHSPDCSSKGDVPGCCVTPLRNRARTPYSAGAGRSAAGRQRAIAAEGRRRP